MMPHPPNCRVTEKNAWPQGMDDYVTKPIRVDALVEALNHVRQRNDH